LDKFGKFGIFLENLGFLGKCGIFLKMWDFFENVGFFGKFGDFLENLGLKDPVLDHYTVLHFGSSCSQATFRFSSN
jgi:hypothetical protein